MTSKASKSALTEKVEQMRRRAQELRQADAVAQEAAQPAFDFGSADETQPADPAEAKQSANKAGSVKRERSKLLPAHHVDRDFFLADMFDTALKDDGASMEAPIFTLSTKRDMNVWHWESKDGSRSITVKPSGEGRATQFDKDVLIFVISQMTEALNRERPDAKSHVVRFSVFDYLKNTNKQTGGTDYKRFEAALGRLRGTSIKTDIKTGGQRVKEEFGLIDSWRIVEKSQDDERMIAVEVNLSRWLYNAVQAHEVLTIHSDYFRLRRPLERRLYELARKHCGHQSSWTIGLELLREKSGSTATLREYRRMVREIVAADTLPEYRITMNQEGDQVSFHTKNAKRLIAGIAKRPT